MTLETVIQPSVPTSRSTDLSRRCPQVRSWPSGDKWQALPDDYLWQTLEALAAQNQIVACGQIAARSGGSIGLLPCFSTGLGREATSC
jgi:hypothetical protein